MNKQIQMRLGFLLAAFLLISAGCSSILRSESGNYNSGGLANVNEQDAPPSEKQLLTKKFNVFVECANRVDERVALDYQDYLRETKEQPAITGVGSVKSDSSWSPPTLGFVSDFDVEKVDALKKAIDAAPPIDPLDAIGRDYAATFERVHNLTKDAADYYAQKDYKDDNFKRAKEMNEPLLEAFKNFENVAKRMSDEIDRLEDAHLQEEFADLEKQNVRNIRYQILNLRITAKRLYRASQENDITLEKFNPLLQNFSQAIDEAKKFVAENKETDENKARFNGLAYSDGSVFGERLQIEAKEFGRHLRDEHKIPASGSGSLKSMTNEYNNLVNALNGTSSIPMPNM